MKDTLITKNRWLILLAGCLIQIVLGGIYAWSTFTPYLMGDYGLNKGQCGLIFGLTILVFTFSMMFSGAVLTRKGPRITACIGAVLFTAGYILASLSGGSFILLLAGIGVVAGAGIGFGYVCPLSVGMKWFPNKKGLVIGVAVAGFGGGAILLSSVAESLLSGGMDVLTFFLWFAVCAGLLLFGAALMLADPPGMEYSLKKNADLSVVFTQPFVLIFIGMFAGTFAGLLIIGNLVPLLMEAGVSEAMATVAVSVFAIGNALGRIAWGHLFDWLEYRSIYMALGFFALMSGFLLLPLSPWLHVLATALLGFGFGANFVVYASAISRYFGMNAFARLYPVCFLAYGVAGITGPGFGGFLTDATGSYTPALTLCTILVLAAGILLLSRQNTFKWIHVQSPAQT